MLGVTPGRIFYIRSMNHYSIYVRRLERGHWIECFKMAASSWENFPENKEDRRTGSTNFLKKARPKRHTKWVTKWGRCSMSWWVQTEMVRRFLRTLLGTCVLGKSYLWSRGNGKFLVQFSHFSTKMDWKIWKKKMICNFRPFFRKWGNRSFSQKKL